MSGLPENIRAECATVGLDDEHCAAAWDRAERVAAASVAPTEAVWDLMMRVFRRERDKRALALFRGENLPTTLSAPRNRRERRRRAADERRRRR